MEPKKEDKEKLSEAQDVKQGGSVDDTSAQESSADAELESGVREQRQADGSVSIGMPVTPDELRRLKEWAEKQDGAELESGIREQREADGFVSIGMPVTPEELRRLKERAEKQDNPDLSDASDPEDHP